MFHAAGRRLAQDVMQRSDILRSPRKFKKKKPNLLGSRLYCPICSSLQDVLSTEDSKATLSCSHIRNLEVGEPC
jgi:hypothetical protein